MNGEQVHLFINHLPIVGSFLAFALVALAALRRGEPGAVYAAALVLGVSALGGGGAYLSGEGAEEIIEERPTFNHDLVEEHEEGAPWALGLLAASAVTGVWLAARAGQGKPLASSGLYAWLAVTALSAAAMTRVGLTGREVGHPLTYGSPAEAPVR